MTGLILLTATALVAVFVVVAIRLDSNLRSEAIDAQLLEITTNAAQQSGLDDPEDAFGALVELGVANQVVYAFTQEVSPAAIRASNLADVIPTELDQDVLIAETIPRLPDDDLAEILELDEPFPSREEMESLVEIELRDAPVEDLYIDFVLSFVEEEGLELELPLQFFRSESSLLDEDEARQALQQAFDGEHEATFEIDGGRLLARGGPIQFGFDAEGAIVAVLDPTNTRSEHSAFRIRIIGLGVLLTLAASIAAWFVAGRAIRPAAVVLARQERFLADAAHELRTPIAAIRSTAEVGVGGDETAALERVVGIAERTSRLTDDLLTFARIDADRLSLRTEPVRLDLLVDAVLDGDPAFRLDAAECIVSADPRLATQAIKNLLANAKNHGGGSPETPADVSVGNGCEVRVRDYGPGIDLVVEDALFERFGSGPTSTGHGLGLPLTRWIARAHGGDCYVDTSVHPGTQFVLRFGE